ncbi:hypothetical protein EYF80_067052 [Liparis tanakae]|uniref:Uncharacterized protein n=1 Tax=Liparis tanakae TaxID=230148 RepID=A0A4Z2E380_9TELE|nr:hypothetical protein EYF80_067052 [Liparis tanakae]
MKTSGITEREERGTAARDRWASGLMSEGNRGEPRGTKGTQEDSRGPSGPSPSSAAPEPLPREQVCRLAVVEPMKTRGILGRMKHHAMLTASC